MTTTVTVGIECGCCHRFVDAGVLRCDTESYAVVCTDCRNRDEDMGITQAVRFRIDSIPIPVARKPA